MRLAPAILLVCLTAAACGGSATGSTHTTPPATTIAPHVLADGLLTAAQLRPVAGTFVRQPVSTTSVTEDPDPRSPCGARVSLPSLHHGAVTELRSRAPAELFQWINDLRPGAAERLVGAFARDVRPGCPAYRTATPYGHPQLNRFIRGIRLPRLGDERLAATTRVRLLAPGGRPAYGTEILIREGNRLTFITLVGLRPQSARVVRAIAIRAAADMTRLASASAG